MTGAMLVVEMELSKALVKAAAMGDPLAGLLDCDVVAVLVAWLEEV